MNVIRNRHADMRLMEIAEMHMTAFLMMDIKTGSLENRNHVLCIQAGQLGHTKSNTDKHSFLQERALAGNRG